MNKWLCIEVCERSLVSVKSFSDQKEAIDHANHLLKQWATKCIDHELEPDDMFNKWDLATPTRPNAWCNYRSEWDAYVVELKDKTKGGDSE